MTFILASKRIATKKARPTPHRDFSEEKTDIVIQRCSREGATFSVEYVVYHRSGDESDEAEAPMGLVWLALHDRAGRRLDGQDSLGSRIAYSSGSSATDRVDGTLTFMLPEGFEPDTIDLMEGTDVEEIRIPFELGEVGLR